MASNTRGHKEPPLSTDCVQYAKWMEWDKPNISRLLVGQLQCTGFCSRIYLRFGNSESVLRPFYLPKVLL